MRSQVAGLEIPGVLWRRDPQGAQLPLVLDSPHSGSHYPDDFAYRCPLPVLRRAEDAYVDELYELAPALGATLIGALFPRSYLDPNRAPDDLDPGMLAGPLPPSFKPRPVTRVGLVRRHVRPGVPIYDRKLSPADGLEPPQTTNPGRPLSLHGPAHIAPPAPVCPVARRSDASRADGRRLCPRAPVRFATQKGKTNMAKIPHTLQPHIDTAFPANVCL